MIGSILNYFGITGSIVQDTPGITTPDPNNLRRVRVDTNGFLQIVGGGSSGVLIAGVAGDDTTLNPFRQVDFVPQVGAFRRALAAVSQELGPLTANKTYHIEPSVDCWVLVGDTGGTAVIGNAGGTGTTHMRAGSTYKYVAKTGRLYVQFIKDTDSPVGYIAISRVEL